MTQAPDNLAISVNRQGQLEVMVPRVTPAKPLLMVRLKVHISAELASRARKHLRTAEVPVAASLTEFIEVAVANELQRRGGTSDASAPTLDCSGEDR